MPFGSAIHRTAEHFWAHRMEGKDVTEDQLADLFAEVWKREVADTENLKLHKGDFDSLLKQGQDLIRVYRRSFPDDCQVVGFNIPFQVPIVDREGELLEIPLVGEIDVLLKHGERLVAADLKTAAQRYSESKLASDLQPTVYLYALKMLRREDILFRWDALLKLKTPVLIHYPAERTEDDFHRLVELIKLMQEMIDSGHFVPNEGSYFCSGCGFQTACREWHLNPTCEERVLLSAGS
jgi:putative RecB family exonuclease